MSDSVSFPYDIDFSKYSTQFSVKFVKHMLKLSEEMDRFSQLKPSIGGQYQIITIRPNQKISLEIIKSQAHFL